MPLRRFGAAGKLGLSLKRFDVIGNENPTLCAFHPNEVTRSEPTRVVKRAGLENEKPFRILRDLIDPNAAIRAEHPSIHIAAVGNSGKSFRRTCHRKAGFFHQH
jgi:hypothetical protein